MNLQDIPKLVINLEKRTDRRDAFIKHWKESVPEWGHVNLMPGVLDDDPMIGIASAHLQCVKFAMDRKWPNVMIMEDDVSFRPRCTAYLDEAVKVLPDCWDILLGGVYEANNLQPFNSHWDRIDEFCGLHFYILSASAYDKVLAYDKRFHIDRWMNMGGKRLNSFVTNKYVAIQRDGFSDNVKANTNYNDLLLNKKKLL